MFDNIARDTGVLILGLFLFISGAFWSIELRNTTPATEHAEHKSGVPSTDGETSHETTEGTTDVSESTLTDDQQNDRQQGVSLEEGGEDAFISSDSSETPTPVSNTPSLPISPPVTQPVIQLPANIQEIEARVTQVVSLFTPGSVVPSAFSAAQTQTLKAAVNIICTNFTHNILPPIIGSGTIIDPRGIILTNAHVAQYFLLKDYPTPNAVDCTIRTGSPARSTYRAELIQIPTKWMGNNRVNIRTANPTGTGEHDYAFLRITERVDGTSLPSTFPSVSLAPSQTEPFIGKQLLVTSYPSNGGGATGLLHNLALVSTVGTISDIFTFGFNNPDSFAITGSSNAHKGSSGGTISNSAGEVEGLIVTANGTSLSGISVAHIDRSLGELENKSLSKLLAGDPHLTAQSFHATKAGTLTNILVSELNKVGL